MKHPTYVTIILIALFIGAQVFGLLVFSKYMNFTTKAPSKDTPIGSIQVKDTKGLNWEFLIIICAAVIIGTGVCLYLIRNNKMNLLKIWIGIALSANLGIALGAFLPAIAAIILAIGLAVTRMKTSQWKYYPWLHNATELALYGGFATIFAFVLNVWTIIALLVVVSIYDMIAVWKSGHMITMAKGLIKGNIFAGFMLLYKDKKAILGGGDIAFPLLAAVVMLKTFGWLPALITIAFATLALTYLFLTSKEGKFYPAMPYLSAGVFIGMLLGWLL